MSDIRLAFELRDERRAHEKTRWWLVGVLTVLLVRLMVDGYLLLMR